MRRLSFAVFICLLLAVPVFAQNDQVLINARPSIHGMDSESVNTFVVTLQNLGSSIDGEVTVSPGFNMGRQHSYHYPVKLPAGKTKTIFVYMTLPYYANVNVTLDGNFTGAPISKDISFRRFYRYGADIGKKSIAIIGDNTEMLTLGSDDPSINTPGTFPRRSYQNIQQSQQSPYSIGYIAPEDSPDRAIGLNGIDVLVLDKGSERLNSTQWDAINQWVLAGGALIMAGGTASVVLQTTDASHLLPVHNLQEVPVDKISIDNSRINFHLKDIPNEPISCSTGMPNSDTDVEGSYKGKPVIVKSAMGEGSVVFVGFNPLQDPLLKWSGRTSFWRDLVKVAEPVADRSRIYSIYDAAYNNNSQTYLQPNNPNLQYSQYNDPFTIELPSVKVIVCLFIIYFLLAVPVSYFVLRKMRRLELAWITAPILSLLFATFFYLFTLNLYKAGLSRRTSGVIFADANRDNARLLAYTECFFPQGGNYDIIIPGAESIELGNLFSNPYQNRGGNDQEHIDTIDNGMVSLLGYRTGNLAYRRFYYSAPLMINGVVDIKLKSNNGVLNGQIANNTQMDLKECVLYCPHNRQTLSLDRINSGQKIDIVNRQMDMNNFNGTYPLDLFNMGSNQIVLLAKTSGASFGPNIGRYKGSDNSMYVIVNTHTRR